MQSAEAVHPSPKSFSSLVSIAEAAVRDGATPGLVILVAQDGRVLFHRAFGHMTHRTPKAPEPAAVHPDTVFDVAGVTASALTTTLVMKAIEMQKFAFSDRVCRYEQGFGILGKSPITVGHLLSHTSGLPAWVAFYEQLVGEQLGARRGILTSRGAREYVFQQINRLELKYPVGSRQVYSDIGVMLLGRLIETLSGLSLEKAAHRMLFQPLGMKSTSFIDLSMIKRRGIHPITDVIAPTEECPWRKRILCGEVHDDNAWAMGGIAGHAGLFTSAYDLYLLSSQLLGAYHGSSDFLRSETVRRFWDPDTEGPEGWRLGWDSPSKENGMLDTGWSKRAVGVNGFSGCSLWLEPEEGAAAIIMSNRIHPSRTNKKFLAVRPELHRAIMEGLHA